MNHQMWSRWNSLNYGINWKWILKFLGCGTLLILMCIFAWFVVQVGLGVYKAVEAEVWEVEVTYTDGEIEVYELLSPIIKPVKIEEASYIIKVKNGTQYIPMELVKKLKVYQVKEGEEK